MTAFRLASTGDDEQLRRGLSWLLDREIYTPGDWTQTTPAEPGGWSRD